MPPAQLGPYRLGRKLGEGGMGVVYLAEDTRHERKVAVKLLRPEWEKESKAVERFHREARITALLQHPHICAVYESGEAEGCHYLVMEFLEGQLLRDKLDGWPLTVEALLDFGIQIAEALEAAHAQGIIHRDIKSSNIFITETGIAKLVDFGLAKLCTSAQQGPALGGFGEVVSMPGLTLGTVTHMSPEQVAGKELDHRSDLFSFGIVLYEMATGVLPFRGIDSINIMQAIADEPYPHPSKINPNLPVRMDEIIGKTLQKGCADRYQTAAELKADLVRLLQELELERDDDLETSSAARERLPTREPRSKPEFEAEPGAAALGSLAIVESWELPTRQRREFIEQGHGTLYWFHASLGELASASGFRRSLQPVLESQRISELRFVLDPAADGAPQQWSKLMIPLIQSWAARSGRVLETSGTAERGRFCDASSKQTVVSWVFIDLGAEAVPSFKVFVRDGRDPADPAAGTDLIEAELLISTRLRSIRMSDGSRQILRVPERVLRMRTPADEILLATLLRIVKRWEHLFTGTPAEAAPAAALPHAQ
ncbi:MAG TPA: serine/threonine-protein kinase [Pseudomonadota bacterium]|nr:serine/threonine-protein kinase [Pseudomonadota bacterium]